jgi:hypothetical protein
VSEFSGNDAEAKLVQLPPAADRATCIGMTITGGPASYVELFAMRNASKLPIPSRVTSNPSA